MVVSLDVCEVTWSELLCIMMRVLLRRPRAAGANRNDTLLASVYACQQQSFNSNEPLSSSSIPGCAAAAARETPCAALACSARTHTQATPGLPTEGRWQHDTQMSASPRHPHSPATCSEAGSPYTLVR